MQTVFMCMFNGVFVCSCILSYHLLILDFIESYKFSVHNHFFNDLFINESYLMKLVHYVRIMFLHTKKTKQTETFVVLTQIRVSFLFLQKNLLCVSESVQTFFNVLLKVLDWLNFYATTKKLGLFNYMVSSSMWSSSVIFKQ